MPSVADRLARFVERYGEDAPQEKITVHGDFHEAQLLLDGNGLTGLLDLDDVGTGERVDDLAMMLGRLYQLSKNWERDRDRISAYMTSLLRTWEQHVDPYELRRRNVRTNGRPFVLPGGPLIPLLASAGIVWLLAQATARELAAEAILLGSASLIYWGRRGKLENLRM